MDNTDLYRMSPKIFSKYMESKIKKFMGASDPEDNSYDALCGGKKIEIKSIRIARVGNTSFYERAITFAESFNQEIKGNINDIKPKYFDYLIISIVWKDKIKYCLIPSEEVNNLKYFSENQRSGGIGDGEIQITNKSLQYLLDNYSISEEDLNNTCLDY